MTLGFALVMAVCLSLTLLWLGVGGAALWPGRKDGDSALTRCLLVALRLAIGWHFVFEAVDKFQNPAWSSEAYLRESAGPLAPWFRDLAGDRLIDQLSVGEPATIPASLEQDWQAYFSTLADFYELTDEQREQVHDVLRQAKNKYVTWATVTKQPVEIISLNPPPLIVDWTIPRRLEEYERLEQLARAGERDLPPLGAEGFETLRTLKSNVLRWRGALKRDLDRQTDLMKKSLREKLVEFAKDELPAEYRNKITKEELPKLRDAVRKQYKDWQRDLAKEDKELPLSIRQAKIFEHVLEKQKKGREKTDPEAGDLLDPLPPDVPAHKPLGDWKRLDWADAIVKYGLLAVGVCLLAGLLTRLACLFGAGYLLMFFLAMPPLPGWPDPPRAEGHYFLINKNIIEMLALLVLASTRSGRWAGVDGLIQFFRPERWRAETGPAKLEGKY